MSDEKLIERLRQIAKYTEVTLGNCNRTALNKAANRLEALQAEIEGLCEALEELLGSCSRQPVGGGERWRYSKQRMHAHEASCKAIDALRKARILIKQDG